MISHHDCATSLSRRTVPSEMWPQSKYSSLPVNCFCQSSCRGDTESQSHSLPGLLPQGKCHTSLPVAQKRLTTAVVSSTNVSNAEVRQSCSTAQDTQRQREVILSWKADSLKGTFIHKRVEGEITLTFEMILWIIKLQLSVVKSGKRKWTK